LCVCGGGGCCFVVSRACRALYQSAEHCDSPRVQALYVPVEVDDATLAVAASFRSKQRLPALTYLHANGAALCRSAQVRHGGCCVKERERERERERFGAYRYFALPLHSPVVPPLREHGSPCAAFFRGAPRTRGYCRQSSRASHTVPWGTSSMRARSGMHWPTLSKGAATSPPTTMSSS
jgi:hypothetical protein